MSMNTVAESRRAAPAASIGRLFAANLAMNASAFLVLMLASHRLTVNGFAELSSLMGAVVVGASLLDFGLNTTVTRRYGAGHGPEPLDAVTGAKAAMLLLSGVAVLLALAGIIPAPLALAAVAAAATNFWSGLRACDQARQNFAAVFRASLALALLRLALGGVALFTGSWMLVALALWVAPVLLLALSQSSEVLRCLSLPFARSWWGMAGYSCKVHVSALCFSALAYLPQFFAKARLEPAEVASFGVVLVLLGPASLLASSVRGYVLPHVTSGGRLGTLMPLNFAAAGLVLLVAGMVAAALLLKSVYGGRLPDVPGLFLVFGSLFAATTLLGFLNLRVHAQGRAGLELSVNALRLALALGLLWAFGNSLFSMVWICGGVMLAGEAFLAILVRRADR